MQSDYIPAREGDLVTWVNTFKTLIVATPTAYGLTTGQATAYGTLATNFITAYNVANADATRSPSAIIAKDEAKALLIASTRQLAGIIQRYPATTNQQRSDLGLTVPVQKAPIPPPGVAPIVDVVGRWGTTVTLRIHDGVSPRRGKPAYVQGADVYSFVGAQAPVDLADWKFEGSTTRSDINVVFAAETAPGTVVWFTAFWYNPRAQTGPGSTPISAILAGGGMQQAA